MQGMKPLALFVFPALLFCQPANQTPDKDKAAVEGHVLNSVTGEPLRKARLVLRLNRTPQAANIRRQQPQTAPPQPNVATSDATGHFEFINVDPGEYQLATSHNGFENLTLGAGDK